MEYIRLAKENLEAEHICCAISSNKDPQVAAKKAWLTERFDDGLVFLRAKERGKCFIEYIPAEKAWLPVRADNYMHVDCFWVSGSFKGHGYADELLSRCIADAKDKGKSGLTVLSSPKKMPFLSDPKYLAHRGFQVADTAQPYFTLLYLPFDDSAEKPCFLPCSQVNKEGFDLYYTAQCPYTAKYVPLLKKIADEKGVPMTVTQITSAEQAKKAPLPFTIFSLFYNGEFITHEILSEKKFTEILTKLIQE